MAVQRPGGFVIPNRAFISRIAEVSRYLSGPTYLFQSGFETGDFSEWTSTTAGTGNTISVVTTGTPESGTYHCSCAISTTTNTCYATKTFSELTDLYALFHIKLADTWNTGGSFGLLAHFKLFDGATELLKLSIQHRESDDKIRWRIFERSNEIYAGAYDEIVTGTYYEVEVHWVADTGGGDGIAQVWQDGVSVVSVSNITGTSTNAADSFRVGVDDHAGGLSDANSTAWIDRVILNDSRIGPL